MTPTATPASNDGVVARGVSWVGLSHVVGQVAWYGSLFVTAALVAPGDFGSVSFAMVLVQVSWLVVGSGTRGSFVTAPKVTAAHVRYATAVNVATGVLVGGGLAAAAGPLAHLLAPGSNVAVLRVLALSIALFGFSIVPLALLQKALLFKRHAAVNAVSALVSSASAIVAVELGMGVWALVLRQVLFQTMLAALAWIAARPVMPTREAREVRTERRPPQAKWFFALTLLAFGAMNIDYIVVGRFTTVTALGLYSLAFTIAFAPTTQFAWQIGKVLFPAAARTQAPADVARRVTKAVRLTALVLFPTVPVATVLAPVLLPRLLGPEWRSLVHPLQILLAVGVAHAVLAVTKEFLVGTGHVRWCVKTDALWLAGTAVALLVLVPTAGIVGAAWAHLVMLLPLLVVYARGGMRRLAVSPGRAWEALADVLLAVAAESAVVAVAMGALGTMGIAPLLEGALSAALGLAVAGAVLWNRRASTLADAWGMVLAVRGRRTVAGGA